MCPVPAWTEASDKRYKTWTAVSHDDSLLRFVGQAVALQNCQGLRQFALNFQPEALFLILIMKLTCVKEHCEASFTTRAEKPPSILRLPAPIA
jgi:hypothetical protein